MFSKTLKEMYLKRGVRYIGICDIETTDLKGNFGYMLTWVLWVYDVKTGKIKKIVSKINDSDRIIMRKNKIIRHKDYRITAKLLKELQKINMFVGFYSDRFDVPFIRTRAFKNNLDYPLYKKIRYFDLWKFARFSLSLNRNGLESMVSALNVKNQKTWVNPDLWLMAREGHRPSLKYITDHNIKDVKMTMKVFLKVAPFVNVPSKYL